MRVEFAVFLQINDTLNRRPVVRCAATLIRMIVSKTVYVINSNGTVPAIVSNEYQVRYAQRRSARSTNFVHRLS